MKKLTLAFIIFASGSYFYNPVQDAEASRKQVHHTPKHNKGNASWYGPGFHGKKTANGERFNMYAMTAAHKTLPLSSYAKVINLKNHRTIIVRINDRGPYHRGRSLDLSYAAAKKLGISGIGSVRIVPI